jgi:hypothetical protein
VVHLASEEMLIEDLALVKFYDTMYYSVYMLPKKNCERCFYHGKSVGVGAGSRKLDATKARQKLREK